MRVDPRVVVSAKILQLNQHELEQAIETELNENPALERLQDDHEPLDNETILKSVAPRELKTSHEDYELARSLPKDEDSFDWLDMASSCPNLHDHLRAQMMAMLPKALVQIGLYLVEAVDERGYLTMSIEEVALAMNCSLESAELALHALRKCEPAGIGAIDLQDCLLLQLREAETLEEKLARTIVRNHLDDFIARRAFRIARKYRVHPEVVEKAFKEILSLNPYPGEGFQTSSSPTQSLSHTVVPDLSLSRTEEGWKVEVKGCNPTYLTINRAYTDQLKKFEEKGGDKEEKRHLATYVQRANDFIHGLEQRQRTLKAIGEFLVQHQPGFVSTGSYRFLQSLTRAELAKQIGVHESTVSRATQDKFVQISTGEVIPFEVFFKPALRVQKMIEEILETENPDNPLSDDRIAQMLSEKGIQVARRTVNKYRDRTKLPSSRKRRSA